MILGMMAEVTTAFAAVGITICSCVAETDRRRGMAVMSIYILFSIVISTNHSFVSQVNACSRVDLIPGVLGWSVGCSWPSSTENNQLLEC
ncbi:relA [Gossypium australe]|uniref:RelA n=1 Tax=Gossypium australe TaxID=47621 RepID=A0A5B6V035_9ROSI|nr:relA [Gossypium australe]